MLLSLVAAGLAAEPTLPSLSGGAPDVGRKVHIAGNITTVSGAVLVLPAVVAWGVASGGFKGDATTSPDPIALGLATVGLATTVGAIYAGPVIATTGAMVSTRKADRKASLAAGVVGLAATGLIIPVSVASADVGPYYALTAPLITTVCGAVQMGQSRRLRRQTTLVPSADGVRLVGTW
ncbi:MAG: hypothetical protein H6734_20650 [Alphaproteobacteria bacterium]|nr:hypothetical protein [Alphaproteobacteria bacterium]